MGILGVEVCGGTFCENAPHWVVAVQCHSRL
jgi:hypothetical protein